MKRSSGILMHISSLWGEYSIGSMGACAKNWIDMIKEAGFSYWQVLPFCLPDEYNSPYKSFSAFSLNPYFIDLDLLYEDNLILKAELNDARQNTPYLCEFERLSKERFSLLKKASSRFKEWDKVDAFLKSHPHTDNFCKFMALKKANNGEIWNNWVTDIPDESEYKAWQFTQYVFFKQWMSIKAYANEKGVKIIGDIPIYIAPDSSDVWSNQSQFLLDKKGFPRSVAGVPPDYFSEDGQLWGNPLYNWKEMKKDNYLWWRQRMEFMTELFDGVRIDHFRGLESFFSIPATETTAKNGKWIKGPGMSFINAIKPICEDKLIIAEDLGDITPEVHALVEKSTFPGMGVLQFAFLGDNNSPHLPHNYKNNLVAYTGTHDNNTLLGYVWELPESTRKRLLDYCSFTGNNWDESYDFILKAMLKSHAGLVIFPVQDVLLYGSDTRLNKPGCAENNWAYRILKEQLEAVDRGKFLYWNELYGRI